VDRHDVCSPHRCSFFSFTVTPPTAIYTLSLHDALPISKLAHRTRRLRLFVRAAGLMRPIRILPCWGASPWRRSTSRGTRCSTPTDRKSTRLNSSHVKISYAVFCLKKKKHLQNHNGQTTQ